MIEYVLYEIPILVVFSVGLAIAYRRRERYPHAARLMVSGCGLHIIAICTSTINQFYLIIIHSISGFRVIHFFVVVCNVIGASLLIAAVFAGREAPLGITAGGQAEGDDRHSSVEIRLARLKERLAQGLISKVEYTELRKVILDSL
jgi:hypothetical protein